MNDPTPRTPPARDGASAEHGDAPGTALAAARDVTAEIFRLLQTTASQATNGWSLSTLMRSVVPELEEVFAAREALEREVHALRASATSAGDTMRELETQLATREAGWRAERVALEAEVAREQDQARSLAEDLARRRTELEMLEGRTRRLREQMEGIAARAHADREETLRLAREMVQSAEDARLALLDEMESLRSALITEQGEQARASQGAAEREAELARARQVLEQLEASRASTATELARVRAALVHTEGELLAAQHEYQLAQVQIDRLLGAHDDLVEDRAQLVAKLHDSSEREARLRLRVNGLEQRLQAVRDGAGDAPDADAVPAPAAEAQVSELATKLSRAEERARTLENELAGMKASASAATARVETLADQTRNAERARSAAEARAAQLEATVAALERVRDATPVVPVEVEPIAAEAPASIVPDGPDVVEAEELVLVETPIGSATGATAEPEEEPQPETEVAPATEHAADALPGTELVEETPAPEPEASPAAPYAAEAPPEMELVEEAATAPVPEPYEAAPAAEPTRSVGVLDAVEGWDACPSTDAACFAPTADAVEAVRAGGAETLLVNVATPGVIASALALRADGVTTPLWACALPAGATTGLALGRFDVVARPVDPEMVAERLGPLVPRGAAVVMVGTESATLIPLRQGLLRIGATVKTAWTIAQARDLVATTAPGLVIFDLAADQAGIAEFVTALAAGDPPPVLVVVSGTAGTVDAFADALRAHAEATGGRECADLLRDAARAIPPTGDPA